MKTEEKQNKIIGFLTIIILTSFIIMSNKGNMLNGHESFDGTWQKNVSVVSVGYNDTVTSRQVAGFKIANDRNDTGTVVVQLLEQTDSTAILLYPGYCPLVVKRICKSARNRWATFRIIK